MTTILGATSSSGFGIATYGDLKDATARWLNRTTLTDVIPDFVQLSEAMIRRDVRVRVQEQFDAGTATGDTIAVPARMLEARRFTLGGKLYDYITPEQFQDYSDANNTTAQHFTLIGESIYVIGGASGQAYSLLYWRAFEAFSADSDTNWLLLNAPDTYLWSTCHYGALYLKDYEAAADFQAKYGTALGAINTSEKNMRFSGSVLRVRVKGRTP